MSGKTLLFSDRSAGVTAAMCMQRDKDDIFRKRPVYRGPIVDFVDLTTDNTWEDDNFVDLTSDDEGQLNNPYNLLPTSDEEELVISVHIRYYIIMLCIWTPYEIREIPCRYASNFQNIAFIWFL